MYLSAQEGFARRQNLRVAVFRFAIECILLGQECHAQNPLVQVDEHVASRLLADRVEAKLLARDEASKIP